MVHFYFSLLEKVAWSCNDSSGAVSVPNGTGFPVPVHLGPDRIMANLLSMCDKHNEQHFI